MCTKTQFNFIFFSKNDPLFIKLPTSSPHFHRIVRVVIILRHGFSSCQSPMWCNSLSHLLLSDILNQLIRNLCDLFSYSPVHVCLIVMILCMTILNEHLPVFTSICFLLPIVNSIPLDLLYQALHSWPVLSTSVLSLSFIGIILEYFKKKI